MNGIGERIWGTYTNIIILHNYTVLLYRSLLTYFGGTTKTIELPTFGEKNNVIENLILALFI